MKLLHGADIFHMQKNNEIHRIIYKQKGMRGSPVQAETLSALSIL